MVAPRDRTVVARAGAQGVVSAIWAEWGLRYPPLVEPLPLQATATAASANRLSIFLPEQTASWCLLHELAHAMTSTEDGHSDGHGPVFLELRSALYDMEKRPILVNYIYGLGGADVRLELIHQVYNDLVDLADGVHEPGRLVYLGAR